MTSLESQVLLEEPTTSKQHQKTQKRHKFKLYASALILTTLFSGIYIAFTLSLPVKLNSHAKFDEGVNLAARGRIDLRTKTHAKVPIKSTFKVQVYTVYRDLINEARLSKDGRFVVRGIPRKAEELFFRFLDEKRSFDEAWFEVDVHKRVKKAQIDLGVLKYTV